MQLNRITKVMAVSLLLTQYASAADNNDETLIVSASKQSATAASSRNVSYAKADESALTDAHVTRTDQLSRVLPGLQMGNSGSLIFQSVSLRGISSAQDFYNPAVTFYVDGVPQLSTFAMQPLMDVESVEMLRGPQGTLYGKSAQGGIINIVTHQPDSPPRGSVEAGYASRDGYHTKFNASGPIQDGLLYGSVTLLREVDQGAMTNPDTGSDHLGGSRTNAGNVRLRLAPDNQPWEASVDITEECTHATQDTYVPFDKVKSRTLDISAGGGDPYLRRCTHSQALSGRYTTDNWIFSLVSAWQQQNYDRQFPYGFYSASLPERWNQNVQELRAATRGNETVDMVFGLYRQDTRESLDSSYSYGAIPLTATRSNNQAETLAAYSDLTWHVTSQFDLGAGLRFSHDRAETRYSGNALGTPWGDNNTTRDDQVLGQVSAGYQFTDAWRVYTRIAQGYKPAGFSITPTAGVAAEPYSAEKSINYEIGSRYEYNDLSLNGAVFYTHTKDMQLYSGPVGYQTLSNAGSADASGVELGARWNFTPGWAWEINGNYVHSEFSDDSVTYANKRVPFVPEFAGGTSIVGNIETAWGALMPRAGVNLTGPQYFDGDNTLKQGSYTTADLSLGWQATDRVTVTAYLNNMFDRRYRTYGFLNGTSAYAQVNNGRTAGLDVRVALF
ncbi:TonB-dependent siderophore receptor [Serratia symbiotica]|uniref:TonB-dependent siderophore receptor n=1 Tax=Serratia symbiotica TaxID=138074 RepID=A0A068Z256_9GAMM|nr:TonB-dependent siderophore receptor [Serratia symbiotica]MBF1995893.1 TonB-dependent siderophore receptor [Serratia symbiotica]QLH64477.1 TonB-dependent siderophore receptor [Serratia symbiotica]CDS57567.1 Pesticin receptor [Serratia symbiotica]